MVDPTEQQKGGFGAAAALRRERVASREAAEQTAAATAALPLVDGGEGEAEEPTVRADKTTTRPGRAGASGQDV